MSLAEPMRAIFIVAVSIIFFVGLMPVFSAALAEVDVIQLIVGFIIALLIYFK